MLQSIYTHAGCDEIGHPVWTLFDVSIHTPTQGVTINGPTGAACTFVSIHTPTQGVTLRLSQRMAISRLFQSTHPRRVWQDIAIGEVVLKGFQSTHPRRVWLLQPLRSSLNGCFNPHTHAGCDDVVASLAPRPISFNPHTHAGCDTSFRGRVVTSCGFNPHTHAGCDIKLFNRIIIRNVSIHTPTQGVTLYLITYYKSANLIHCYANHHYYSTS